MAWVSASVAQPGQYLLAVTVSGLNLDVFGAISNLELIERIRSYVTGASVIQVQVARNLFSGDVRIFARADRPVALDGFALEVESALNSFWTLAGVKVNAYVSDSLEANLPAQPGDQISETVKWVAAAVIIAAIVIGIVQIRKVAT